MCRSLIKNSKREQISVNIRELAKKWRKNKKTNEEETIDLKVRRIIAEECELLIEHVNPESNFKDDLGGHSLNTIMVVEKLEERFDIKIPNDVGGKIAISTVQEIIDIVKKELAKTVGEHVI